MKKRVITLLLVFAATFLALSAAGTVAANKTLYAQEPICAYEATEPYVAYEACIAQTSDPNETLGACPLCGATDWFFQEKTEATCEEDGREAGYLCLSCYNYRDGVPNKITRLGHDIVVTERIEPTCESAGRTEGRRCSRCDKMTVLGEEIPALGHTPVAHDGIAPTCTEEGCTPYEMCAACDKVLKAGQTIPATGHKFNQWNTEREATCTKEGLLFSYCENCDAREEQTVAPLGHVEERVAEQAATCTQAGHGAYTVCTRCKEALTQTMTIPASGHKFSTGTLLKEATCETDGLIRKECAECHETKEEILPATGHQSVAIDGQAPTCTQAGFSAYTVCEICQKELTEKTVLSALGHEFAAGTLLKEATCETDGLLKKECARCHETKEEILPATGHQSVAINGQTPTCTQAGFSAYTVCEVCRKELTEKTILPALEHLYEGGKLVKDATCEETGILRKECARCHEIEEETVPATGHSPMTKAGTEATCTQTGKTASTVCNVCGKILEEAQEIPKKDHRYENGTCLVCGCLENHSNDGGNENGETPFPPSCPHEYGDWTEQKATCTEAGFRVRTCRLCGKEEQTVLPAHGHEFGDFAEVKSPTCTQAGALERVCKYDSAHVERRELAPLGHTLAETAGKEATCEEAGYTAARICNVCKEIISAREEIAPLGHDWEEKLSRQPTYREKGETTRSCTRCGKTEREELAPLGGKGAEFLALIDLLRTASGAERETLADRAKTLYAEAEYPELLLEEYGYLQDVLAEMENSRPQPNPPDPESPPEKHALEPRQLFLVLFPLLLAAVIIAAVFAIFLIRRKNPFRPSHHDRKNTPPSNHSDWNENKKKR